MLMAATVWIIGVFMISTLTFTHRYPSDGTTQGRWPIDAQILHVLTEQGRSAGQNRSLSYMLADISNTLESVEKRLSALNHTTNTRASMEPLTCTILQANMHADCLVKIRYLRENWKVHPCYAEHGVNGSDCSILAYLSNVEHWCPSKAPWSNLHKPSNTPHPLLHPRRNLTDLLAKILVDDKQNYEWIKDRIRSRWDKWLAAYDKLVATWKPPRTRQKKILLHLGLLTRQSKLHWSEKISAGLLTVTV